MFRQNSTDDREVSVSNRRYALHCSLSTHRMPAVYSHQAALIGKLTNLLQMVDQTSKTPQCLLEMNKTVKETQISPKTSCSWPTSDQLLVLKQLHPAGPCPWAIEFADVAPRGLSAILT